MKRNILSIGLALAVGLIVGLLVGVNVSRPKADDEEFTSASRKFEPTIDSDTQAACKQATDPKVTLGNIICFHVLARSNKNGKFNIPTPADGGFVRLYVSPSISSGSSPKRTLDLNITNGYAAAHIPDSHIGEGNDPMLYNAYQISMFQRVHYDSFNTPDIFLNDADRVDGDFFVVDRCKSPTDKKEIDSGSFKGRQTQANGSVFLVEHTFTCSNLRVGAPGTGNYDQSDGNAPQE